jgi:membrane-associated phospholipid phosphatase
VRGSRLIRTTAWAVVAAGVAAPLVRHRLKLPPAATLTLAASAPVALCVAIPRTRARDVSVVSLQMWAYLNAYELPNDDPDALARRVRTRYPLAADRVLGLGVPPTVRLQRLATPPGEPFTPLEQVLAWTHWWWFAVPHAALAYVMWRRPERFDRAAVLTYAVFDLGCVAYWVVPTAPPWWVAERGLVDLDDAPRTRRMMLEHAQRVWRSAYGHLYSLLGGNPLAAMPSLHFATSVMAAHLLSEVGPLPGTLGWAYALTLGVALVYLGEHWLVDLLAGLALTEAVRTQGPRAAPLVKAVAGAVSRLEAAAHGRRPAR